MLDGKPQRGSGRARRSSSVDLEAPWWFGEGICEGPTLFPQELLNDSQLRAGTIMPRSFTNLDGQVVN